MERVPEISCYSKVQHKHLKEKLPEPIRNHQSAKRPTAAFNLVKKNWGRGRKKKERKQTVTATNRSQIERAAERRGKRKRRGNGCINKNQPNWSSVTLSKMCKGKSP